MFASIIIFFPHTKSWWTERSDTNGDIHVQNTDKFFFSIGWKKIGFLLHPCNNPGAAPPCVHAVLKETFWCITPLQDIFNEKFTTRRSWVLFAEEGYTMGCLAAFQPSSLSRTGVFLSTSLTLGGLCMLHLFIYLLHSSDMSGHPCLECVEPPTEPGWWHWLCFTLLLCWCIVLQMRDVECWWCGSCSWIFMLCLDQTWRKYFLCKYTFHQETVGSNVSIIS